VVERLSSVYETEPWGNPDQPAFLNQAVEVRTDLAPFALLAACREIEKQLGRRPGPRWGPRAADLDILLFGSTVLDSEALSIPHPRLADRRFVLAPLAEIAAGLPVPPSGRTVSELLDACEDAGEVRRIGPNGRDLEGP
jgi:2-amino-4-hydroxy-6-hydroxymethyldihydropteridine diphosphokinase